MVRRRRLERLDLSVVGGFVFVGWDVVELAVQASIVVPLDPLHGRVVNIVDSAQWAVPKRAPGSDGFGFEQPNRRLGQGIIPCRRLRLTSLVISELFG